MTIKLLRGTHFFLSNFSDSPKTPPTLEHHYQAAKTDNLAYKDMIMSAKTPAEAKRLARNAPIKPNWNEIKLKVMEDLLRKKFSDPTLKKKLIETGNEEIIEENWWGDKFWGICNNEGKNNLGKLLMKIRDELKNEKSVRRIGIVGHGSNKFDQRTRRIAENLIISLIEDSLSKFDEVIIISGHSPVGGIDIWAEEQAEQYGLKTEIKTPKQNIWDAEYGYKQRNLDIANCSDEVHIILVAKYPDNYKGQRFEECYHCAKHKENKIAKHVKSGGCWTGWEAVKAGKQVFFHVIN